MTSNTLTQILFLTDIHFTASKEKIDQEIELIDELIKEAGKQDIKILVIGGDVISMKDDPWANVQHAVEMIERIRTGLLLNRKDIFICAGNHDVSREELAKDIKDFIDESLKVKPLDKRQIDTYFKRLIDTQGPDTNSAMHQRYKYFTALLNQVGANRFGGPSSELTGSIVHRGIRFTVYNSSWLCGIVSSMGTDLTGALYAQPGVALPKWPLANEDRAYLLLGDDIIDKLHEDYNIRPIDDMHSDDEIQIGIIHHPPGWMNHREVYYEKADATPNYTKIINRSHVILSGHEHPLYKTHDKLNNKAIQITGAALIPDAAQGKLPHSYHIVTVDKVNRHVTVANYEMERSGSAFQENKTLLPEAIPLYEPATSLLDRLNKIADPSEFSDCQQKLKDIIKARFEPLVGGKGTLALNLINGSDNERFGFSFTIQGRDFRHYCIRLRYPEKEKTASDRDKNRPVYPNVYIKDMNDGFMDGMINDVKTHNKDEEVYVQLFEVNFETERPPRKISEEDMKHLGLDNVSRRYNTVVFPKILTLDGFYAQKVLSGAS